MKTKLSLEQALEFAGEITGSMSDERNYEEAKKAVVLFRKVIRKTKCHRTKAYIQIVLDTIHAELKLVNYFLKLDPADMKKVEEELQKHRKMLGLE